MDLALRKRLSRSSLLLIIAYTKTARRIATTLPATTPIMVVVVFVDSSAMDAASITVLGVGVGVGEDVSLGDTLGDPESELVGVFDGDGRRVAVIDGVADGVVDGAAFRLN
jgi:hypothetical protein